MELDIRMISAEWLKNRWYEICDEYNTERLHIDRIIDEIDNAPDVEVVRCKDCKHWQYRESGFGDCKNPRFHIPGVAEITMNAEDHCSLGERKGNG